MSKSNSGVIIIILILAAAGFYFFIYENGIHNPFNNTDEKNIAKCNSISIDETVLCNLWTANPNICRCNIIGQEDGELFTMDDIFNKKITCDNDNGIIACKETA